MFQSPLGGIAFIINILIVALSSLNNKLRGHHMHKPIITQKHIDELHSSDYGRKFSYLLAYLIPIFIFASVSALASQAYTFFYNDYKKITLIDVAENGFELSKRGYAYIERITTEDNNRNWFTNINYNKDPINLYLGTEVYKRTQLQALILQDKIAETAIETFPSIADIFTKR